jgi:hypothetical protein
MVLHDEIEISVLKTCRAQWAYDFGNDRKRNAKCEFERPCDSEKGSQFDMDQGGMECEGAYDHWSV